MPSQWRRTNSLSSSYFVPTAKECLICTPRRSTQLYVFIYCYFSFCFRNKSKLYSYAETQATGIELHTINQHMQCSRLEDTNFTNHMKCILSNTCLLKVIPFCVNRKEMHLTPLSEIQWSYQLSKRHVGFVLRAEDAVAFLWQWYQVREQEQVWLFP